MSPEAAVERCLDQTATALHHLGAATPAELTRAIDAVRQSHANGHPGDLIEAIVHLQGTPQDQLSPAMARLAERIGQTMNPSPSLIPFAGRLITPTSFYEAYPGVRKLVKSLLSPVIYAEDTDAIGTASLNPVAASIAAEQITLAVFQETGISPFVSIAILDFESWANLTRKHFAR